MTATQLAMVEELAAVIKDNLSSKHIVLSVEEILIDCLQNDKSSDGILELEPMSPYHRLLLHRLADIYGFAHESVGEGDSRHLILERCPDSSIPAVLVSDILWQYDHDCFPVSSYQLLRRNEEAVPAMKVETAPFPPAISFEEREAAYLAARERIFSVDCGEVKESFTPKQRHVPIVARRMIAHALGQKIHCNVTSARTGSDNDPNNLTCALNESSTKSSTEGSEGPMSLNNNHSSASKKEMLDKPSRSITCHTEKMLSGTADEKSTKRITLKSKNNAKIGPSQVSQKMEHIGAAKRMFAYALGLPKENPGLTVKHTAAKREKGLRS